MNSPKDLEETGTTEASLCDYLLRLPAVRSPMSYSSDVKYLNCVLVYLALV